MKKIITSAIAILAFTVSFAQEKGDNFIGLNFGVGQNESTLGQFSSENKSQSIGITTSNFLKINRRLILDAFLISSNSENINTGNNPSNSTSKSNGYSINLGYGMLFPLLKSFYAEATPYLGYSYNGITYKEQNVETSTGKSNNYGLGVRGGLVWLPFKHFGLSATLLAANSVISRNKQKSNNGFDDLESSSTSISLTTNGNLQNQSFTIFYKF